MTPLRLRSALIVLLLATLVVPLTGQIPGARGTPPAPVQEPADPLGRSTPRGTFLGFNRVAQRGDLVTATRYMQLNAKLRPDAETLARELRELLDRYFDQPIATISNTTAGVPDDGLPADREKLGPLRMKAGETDIILVHVDDPGAGPLWLISTDTLAKVPALYDAIEKSWFEQVMPQPMLDHSLFGISIAQWVLLIASLLIPLWLFSMLLRFVVLLVKLSSGETKQRIAEAWRARTHWPLIAVLAITAHLIVLRFLGFSVNFRFIYLRFGLVLLIIAITSLIMRVSGICFERARSSMERKRRSDTESLMLVGERIFNVILVLATILLILTTIGVDTTTALAGVGIGGVAFAFGAQRTVENLLGGISLITDKALAVGDFCRISDRLGTIEDITLRSVRLRTLDQTLLSIPAGILSQSHVENFATRKKILAQTTLRLRYGTTAEQVRAVLDEVRRLLKENPKVEPQTARVRLINFGERAIELELFAYVLTEDNAEFLAVREEILLRVAGIVESAGTAFASPTELSVQPSRDADLQPESVARRAS